MRELLSPAKVKEMKLIVAGAATTFGKSLSDITHAMTDRIFDVGATVFNGLSRTAGSLTDGASVATDAVVDSVSGMVAVLSKQVSEGMDRVR